MEFSEPKKISKLLENYSGTWAIAGGWAIDLFLNKETRKHKDIEVFILREEQLKLRNYLSNWKFKFANNGRLIEWAFNEYLELPIHEIHCQNTYAGEIEILLNEQINGSWRFRRNSRIEYPMNQVIIKSDVGIPIVSPEVVLLYKAKINQMKDILDLKNTLPKMGMVKVSYLRQWILDTHGNHDWLKVIEKYTAHNTST